MKAPESEVEMVSSEKTCKRCGETKPLDAFRKRKGRKRSDICKRCANMYRKNPNYYGKPEGEYIDKLGRKVVVRYSKDGLRMQCTAHVQGGDRQCRRWSEAERDKCAMHGGKARIVTGTTSKYKGGLRERMKRFINSPNVKSLRDEVATSKALLDQAIDAYDEATKDDSFDFGRAAELAHLIDKTRTAVESLGRLEEGLRLTIDMPQMESILTQIVAIIKEEVPEEGVVMRIGNRLKKLVVGGETR